MINGTDITHCSFAVWIAGTGAVVAACISVAAIAEAVVPADRCIATKDHRIVALDTSSSKHTRPVCVGAARNEDVGCTIGESGTTLAVSVGAVVGLFVLNTFTSACRSGGLSSSTSTFLVGAACLSVWIFVGSSELSDCS